MKKNRAYVTVGPWRVKLWSKTLWFNILSVAAYALAQPELRELLDLRLVAAVNVALRLVTNESLVTRVPVEAPWHRRAPR